VTQQEIDALLRGCTPPVRALAEATRRFVLERFPGAVEQVKPGWNALWYGTGSKASDQILVIQPQSSYVNLAFAKGASLPDPAGLLDGTGKSIRHVKVKDANVLERPELQALVAAAVGK
jgi:hypothetical protein